MIGTLTFRVANSVFELSCCTYRNALAIFLDFSLSAEETVVEIELIFKDIALWIADTITHFGRLAERLANTIDLFVAFRAYKAISVIIAELFSIADSIASAIS
jgi:hypothetical protein